MIKVKVRDNARLEKFLRNRIATIPAICQTRTTIALATYKETAKITLPDQPPS
jgi:DNA-binding Lrp family transcriptional regulator